MRSFTHVIMDKEGLHARSCVIIVHEATKWVSDIVISCHDREVDAKLMTPLLSLKAMQGDTLMVSCEGPDEVEALSALQAVMRMSI